MKTIFNLSALQHSIQAEIDIQLQPLRDRIAKLENENAQDIYMTKLQAAKYLQCSTSTIDNYVKRGLPKCTISRAKVLFLKSDLDKFIQSAIN